jgi:hypothetical protein
MSVNSQNFAIAHSQCKNIIAPQTVVSAGATTSSAIDLEAVGAAEEAAFVVSAGTLGTSGTLAIKIQGSADNSTYADLTGAAITITAAKFAAGLTAIPISIGRAKAQALLQASDSLNCRYLKLVATSSAANATISATYLGSQMRTQPLDGLVNGIDFLAMSN